MAIWKGYRVPRSWGGKLTMVINHLRNRMILRVGSGNVTWDHWQLTSLPHKWDHLPPSCRSDTFDGNVIDTTNDVVVVSHASYWKMMIWCISISTHSKNSYYIIIVQLELQYHHQIVINTVKSCNLVVTLLLLLTSVQTYYHYIPRIYPLPSNSHHQDHYILSKVSV